METDTLIDLASIIWLDVVLSGDNALVIGLAASTLVPEARKRAVVFGLVLAAVIRIVFAAMTAYLLQVPGLLVVGGLALFWVAYGLVREIMRMSEKSQDSLDDIEGTESSRRSMVRALVSITIADISMSIDNVLAVGAIARDSVELLVFGLVLSIALMGLCATLIMKLLIKHVWISYIGVGFLVYIGGEMIWDGWASFMTLFA